MKVMPPPNMPLITFSFRPYRSPTSPQKTPLRIIATAMDI